MEIVEACRNFYRAWVICVMQVANDAIGFRIHRGIGPWHKVIMSLEHGGAMRCPSPTHDRGCQAPQRQLEESPGYTTFGCSRSQGSAWQDAPAHQLRPKPTTANRLWCAARSMRTRLRAVPSLCKQSGV